ncbi:MAG: hypothetical protein WHU10_10565 [Fimbriimonadales bacterium]
MLDSAEHAHIQYAIGFGGNDRLLDRVLGLCEKAERLWECNADGCTVRLYTSFSSIQHAAGHGRAAWLPRSNGVGRG